jgi:hypothetical protein
MDTGEFIEKGSSNDPPGTQAPAAPVEPLAISAPARVARGVYIAGIYLLGVAVLVQFLFAGLGIFFDPQFLAFWHAAVGAGVIGGLSLVLVPIGLLGRVSGRTLWLTASVLGLVVLQSLLLTPFHAGASGAVRAVSALHVVNALLIFWVVYQLVIRASALRSAQVASRQWPRSSVRGIGRV